MRAQVATEFMVYTTVFMLFVVSAYLVINQVQNVEIPTEQNTVAKETGQGFADVLALSVNGGSGFSYNYMFPRTILGYPYVIDFGSRENNTLMIEWYGPYGNFTYAYPLPNYNYTIETSSCLNSKILNSSSCQDVLTIQNTGDERGLLLSQGSAST